MSSSPPVSRGVFRFAVSSVVPALPSLSGSENATVPPEAALRFMSWLQAGLADGTLTFNQAGAMVHFVAEGMLLVSPRIFQCFAKAFGEDVVASAAKGAIVISLQAFIRRHIDKGSDSATIQTAVAQWKPDSRTIIKQTAFERASGAIDKLTPEERKALIAKLSGAGDGVQTLHKKQA